MRTGASRSPSAFGRATSRLPRHRLPSRIPVLVVTALALGCAGAGPQPPARPEGGPRADATEGAATMPHLEERGLLLLLADRQTYESLVVRRSLAGPPELREDLALALGRSGDPRGLDALLGLLLDDEASVRRAAAFALGEMGEALPAVRDRERRRAAAALLDAATDPDRRVGALAVEAVGKLGVTVDQVAARLGKLERAERQARLLPSLHRFPDPETPALALRGLDAEDPALRRRAVLALTRHPRPESLPALRSVAARAGSSAGEGSGDGRPVEPLVAAWVARALGEIGDAGDLELLRPLLGRSGRPTRADRPAGVGGEPVIAALEAGRALVADGRAAPPDDWRDRLMELLDDPRPAVRLTAIDAASAWLLEERLGDLLAERVAGEATDGVSDAERGAALVALATGGDPRAEELAAAAAGAAGARLRSRAAEAAGILGARSLLERLADDPEPRVRRAVFGARAALMGGGEDPSAAALARRALQDPDPGVRAAVLGWLADHPVLPVSTVGRALARALEPGTGGEVLHEPLAAVDALVARAREAPDGGREREAATALLARAVTEGVHPVRRRAADGLAALGGDRPAVGPVDTGRSAAVYRRILLETRAPRTAVIGTERGTIRVRLACPEAPLTCVNFLRLAGQGFYDGSTVHGLVPGRAVQGGDPRGDGWGGPGYAVRDEVNRLPFGRGVLGMALSGPRSGIGSVPDTGGSRFFVTLAPQPRLEGAYTAFGEVVDGGEILDELLPGDRVLSIREVGSGR